MPPRTWAKIYGAIRGIAPYALQATEEAETQFPQLAKGIAARQAGSWRDSEIILPVTDVKPMIGSLPYV